jgi:hypothetical protein
MKEIGRTAAWDGKGMPRRFPLQDIESLPSDTKDGSCKVEAANAPPMWLRSFANRSSSKSAEVK